MRRSESNRRNGQLSTGPRTPEGRATSAKNAVKHGLTSREVVLASESIEVYDQLLEDLTKTFNPEDPFEKILVMRIAQCTWRLQRITRIESQLFDCGAQDSENHPIFAGIGIRFGCRPPGIGDVFKPLASSNTLSNLMKYEAHCERALARALRDLERIQILRACSQSTLDVAIKIPENPHNMEG